MLPIIMLVPVDKWIVRQFCERKGELELTTFSEPLTGLRAIARRKPDLVFLNIEMNTITYPSLSPIFFISKQWRIIRKYSV